VYICVVCGRLYLCCTTQIYMTTYNTNINDHIQHKYTRPLTTQIYMTTYNTNINDHIQHKYTRPHTTQIYTVYICVVSGRVYLCCKWSCIFVLYVVVYICVVYVLELLGRCGICFRTARYTPTYNTNKHGHLQHKYTRPHTTQI
jgi:hypothetical protein